MTQEKCEYYGFHTIRLIISRMKIFKHLKWQHLHSIFSYGTWNIKLQKQYFCSIFFLPTFLHKHLLILYDEHWARIWEYGDKRYSSYLKKFRIQEDWHNPDNKTDHYALRQKWNKVLWRYMQASVLSFFCPWDSPGKNTGMGCHFLLQGIFPTLG